MRLGSCSVLIDLHQSMHNLVQYDTLFVLLSDRFSPRSWSDCCLELGVIDNGFALTRKAETNMNHSPSFLLLDALPNVQRDLELRFAQTVSGLLVFL